MKGTGRELSNDEYFNALCELEYIRFRIEQMLISEKQLSVIERMIDESSGFDKKKLQDAKKLIARCNKLKNKLGIAPARAVQNNKSKEQNHDKE